MTQRTLLLILAALVGLKFALSPLVSWQNAKVDELSFKRNQAAKINDIASEKFENSENLEVLRASIVAAEDYFYVDDDATKLAIQRDLEELFIRNEAKIPTINSKLITVTEVRMTPDLKTARVYVIPLGGANTKETVKILTEYSHLVRRALSKRLDIKFLPKLTFVEDNSFEYAEKIENIIKKIKQNDTEKKRYN